LRDRYRGEKSSVKEASKKFKKSLALIGRIVNLITVLLTRNQRLKRQKKEIVDSRCESNKVASQL